MPVNNRMRVTSWPGFKQFISMPRIKTQKWPIGDVILSYTILLNGDRVLWQKISDITTDENYHKLWTKNTIDRSIKK